MFKPIRRLVLASAVVLLGITGLGAQVESRDFEKVIADLKSGSSEKLISAAAELAIEHPDRFDEYAQPFAELLLSSDRLVRDTIEAAFQLQANTAVEYIKPWIETDDIEKFRWGCSVVHAVGDPAVRYRESLGKQLKSDDRRFVMAALYALESFSDGAPDSVGDIIPLLDIDDFQRTVFACRVIIQTGSAAKSAVPALKELLENGNVSHRSLAAWALGAIGQTDDFDTLAVLQDMLDNFTVVEKERALMGLGLIGADAKPAVDKVRELMKTGSGVATQAALTLWQIEGSTAAEEASARLIELSKTTDFEITALNLLARIQPPTTDSIDRFKKLLKSPDESVRETAARAIGRFAVDSPELKLLITPLLEDPDPAVRLTVHLAYAQLADNDSDN